MNSKRVHLRGQEHLPPILREFADDTYQYSSHKHTVETTKDGILHTYSVILSQYPLKGGYSEYDSSDSSRPMSAISSSLSDSRTERGNLVSQIKSTTTSEKERVKSMRRTPMVTESESSLTDCSTSITRDTQYQDLSTVSSGIVPKPRLEAKVRPMSDSMSASESESSIPPSYLSSSSGTSSRSKRLPKYTYSSNSIKSARSAKFVMMVHVKFLFLHRDVFNKRAQSMFSDEFPSDCCLEDVIHNFHQLCLRQLRNNELKPRLSYCVGELTFGNSKPVQPADMRKTLAQLANSNSVIQFSLIVDNT